MRFAKAKHRRGRTGFISAKQHTNKHSMRRDSRLDLKVGRVAPRAVELFNVGQASRLPSECASARTKSNPSPASLTEAGGTPALLCRLGLEPRRVAHSCREALPVPSESGSKLHAVQTLARSSGAWPLREAFGVRPVCRRFVVAATWQVTWEMAR